MPTRSPSAVAAKYKNPDNDPRGPYVLSDPTSPLERQQTYEWRGHLPPPGRSWRYSRERVLALEDEGRIVFPAGGSPRLKRYLDEAESPEPIQEFIDPPKRLELILRPAMQKLVCAVTEDPACLRHMEWRDLERMLREVFEAIGFQTLLTRSSKDGGFDLRLETDRSVFLVEVKHWINSKKKPGPNEVTALFDVVVCSPDSASGVLLSSTGFTQRAIHGRTEVQQQLVRLGSEEKIVSLCQEYVQSTAGVWAPNTDLARLLVEGTR